MKIGLNRLKSRRREFAALVAGTILAVGGSMGAAHAQPTVVEPSSFVVTPRVYQQNCPSTYYKVVFRGFNETTDSWVCFNGVGIWTPPAQASGNNLEYIVKVCPGNNRGRIQYKLADGNTYNSTWRGPHANNSTCYSFAPDMPRPLIHVEIT